MSTPRTRVLFVCMGNICRSPTAEGVFRRLVEQSPLRGKVDIDSAGTTGAHAGQAPDPRAIEVAARRGYDLTPLRARQVTPADFEQSDFVIAMDDMNVRYLKGMCPTRLAQRIELLLDYGGEEDEAEVPDPYYGSLQDFEHTLDLIEEGCQGLLEYLADLHLLRGDAGLKRDH
ncbi:MAG: low molecular weight phosphotyrosine protein phosphatase [Betaproteobacteria bacterium]|nr:low molecular weight phosphotyrosine protein phosphatase [Betaproteobacteria bacterium]